MNKQPRFAVLRFRSRNGRDYYQAREVGSVACRIRDIWHTPNRAVAEGMASEVGGTVVELNQ